jgi:F-type H+-transporting ATPase subunit a
MPLLIQAKDSKPSGDLKTEIKEYIFHHLEDAYDFSLFSYTKDNGDHKYIGMPLPVILWDDGLQIFSSSKLQHGEGVAQVGSNFYKLDHGKIFKTNALGVINLDAGKHVTNEAPLDFSVTKGVFSMLLIAFFNVFSFQKTSKVLLEK